MKLVLTVIYDSLIKEFSTPIFFESKGKAIRSFQNGVNDEKSSLFNFPDQFTMFYIGDLELDTGRFESLSTPESLGLALNFKTEV